MPWKSNADLPGGVRNSLPDEAQTVFRNVANRIMQDGGAEVSAIRQAWTAVKNGWEKHGDNWVRKPHAEKLSKGTDTMSDQIAFFLPFEKKEKQADGSIIVQGYASTPTKDLDGEVISLDAVKKALPGYMEWRNIRQMHQPIAVGTAKEAHVDDNGLFLRARIVEPGAVNLVDQGVLQGYSIGGRKLAKKGDVITDLELIEISLVDRPCNPDCRFNVTKGATVVAPHRIDLVKAIDHVEDPPLIKFGGVELARNEVGLLGKLLQKFSVGGAGVKTVEAIRPQQTLQPLPNETPQRGEGMDVGDEDDEDKTEKRQFSDKQRQRAAAAGHAMPGGGYPIENTDDLSNAVQAFGRAKDKAKTKRHIIRQAKRLGATHMLPADWPGSTKGKESMAKAADLYTVSNMISVLGQLEALEEACEGEAGFCIPCGGTTINPGKEFNDQFGTLLTQFADMVADLLDRIIADMKTEEAGEAAEKLSKAYVLAGRIAKRKIDDVNEQIARELAVTHQALAKEHGRIGDTHMTEGLPQVGKQYKQSAKLHAKAAKHFDRAADHFSVGNLDKGHDRMKDGHKAAEEAEKHDKDSFIKSPIAQLDTFIETDPMAKLDGFVKGDIPPPDAPRAGVAVDVFAELTGLTK